MKRLEGKRALVVGASSGIGEAVTELFSDEGASVVVADRGRAAERAELAARARAKDVDAFDLECDVLDEAQVAAAVDETVRRFGRIDIIVNNAGVSSQTCDFVEQDWANWATVLDVNLRGVGYGMKHALRYMLPQGYGRIINTASQMAHKPAPRNAVYNASKAGVVALSSSVAAEVADQGVTVNCVCPGPTDTPMWQANDPKWNAWKAAQLPIKRLGTPKEVAWAYVYLASDEATYMIGQSVSPNGGDVMW
jgi:NAD(P)-dependent dehydrogenase (short-subunit alcohol dehydrogenase family)